MLCASQANLGVGDGRRSSAWAAVVSNRFNILPTYK